MRLNFHVSCPRLELLFSTCEKEEIANLQMLIALPLNSVNLEP